MYFRMFDKLQVKKIFGLYCRDKMTDEEFIDRGSFIIAVMNWNGYDAKSYVKNYLPFKNRFNPNWKELYSIHLQDPEKIKTSNPLCPRLTNESKSDYMTRLYQFDLNTTEPK